LPNQIRTRKKRGGEENPEKLKAREPILYLKPVR